MVKNFLFDIKDQRRKQGQRYELGHILLLSILAILSGANSYRKIASFMATQYAKLDEAFGLGWKGRPAYTTIRELIRTTNNEELESSFRRYSEALAALNPGHNQIVFDGKVLRGNFDHFKDQKAIQMLSCFLVEQQIILAHEEISHKTNEIPTAQEMIERLGVSDKLLTFDALHCQEKTLRVAQASGNEVIVQVKANQKTLLNDCKRVASTQAADATYQEPFSKAHNRIESRKVEFFLEPDLTDADKWQAVAAVLKVERFRQSFHTKTKSWKNSHETAYYIATTLLPPDEFCFVIRNHWGIENRDHYVRDVTFAEDRSRIRNNPLLFAKLRSFALNILRVNRVHNVSQALFDNCMNLNSVLNYVGVR